jgi:hypothetical protein
LLLWCHLVQNVYIVLHAGQQVIIEMQPAGDAMMQCAVASFALAGIPVILIGLHGVWYRIHTNLWVYSWYLMASVLFDMLFVVKSTVLAAPCDHLPSMIAEEGQAFACGVARISEVVAMLMALGIQCYLLFVVSSLCEDLQLNGGTGMTGLLQGFDGAHKMHIAKRAPGLFSWLFGGAHLEELPVGYGSAVFGPDGEAHGHTDQQLEGMGFSKRIFNGCVHEMDFPPRK